MASVLIQRVATAAVLAPVFVAAILFLPEPYFAVLLGVFVGAAAWEWAGFADLRSDGKRAAFAGATLAAGALGLTLPVPVWPVLLAATVLWACAGAYLWRRRHRGGAPGSLTARALIGALALAAAWLAIVWMRAQPPDGAAWVLSLFLLIWCADVGAYFIGRRFGQRKLAPAISPGKTVAGLFGGLGAGMLCATLIAWLRETPRPGSWLLLCAATILFSVSGDLLESLMKRSAGLKDSGSLMPGHGGVLDRVDSVLAAAPIFAFGFWLLAP